ncbi:hypothetical protein COW99_04205 [Candidatus Roizmanbacteria bacterium CG22_combo_CG10-13_8_21_14_all_38_20]|uniref:PIN domain-containing protein n=1 Tax=Candidatus Roizmanbacteria bacterium CG22_combo_CG10-13_8_21_14_all_38_20 TaxID=1974862 RepID=A0A2H0BUW4_9BACT|nr:type II toxin-antitoxin system VapC family toxin [Candidatus Microgenomates bacterium]PIP61476.1 MAG: hypothetical protein COW99_04205 [Candidatus Roizmanbacteria bacterium CG22_combo_CG10-13_8_21_14_all_38_20]PJC30702.1 MAG: hypothetical protein CO050_05370 [Candidatus Roizmanbacteria bacterium CG_4_9_14_0_2_um_filter_38_17]
MASKITPEIVDTNILLRYLVGDEPKQHLQAVKWFKEAKRGKRKLRIPAIVIAETCFVLESFYKLKRESIAEALEILISQKWIKITERKVLLSLFEYYRQGLHFVDSYLLSWSKYNNEPILTFDKQLLKKVN